MDDKCQQTARLLLGFTLFCMLKEITSIHLDNRGYKNVPTIEADWTVVSLRYNLIETILANEVAPATKLDSINFEGNLIEFIHDDAFISCVVLRAVTLDDNRLTALPASFGPNPIFFDALSVERNWLLSTPYGYFARFPSLKRLFVKDTDIDIVDVHDLGTVEALYTNNKNYMPNFYGNTYLGLLMLDNLNVTTFPPEHLSNMTRLGSLFLRNSKLEVFPKIINIPFLSEIFLTDSSNLRVIHDLSRFPTFELLKCDNCPFHCGPDLCWFLLEAHNMGYMSIYPLICASPPEFNNSYITILSPMELRCYEGLCCSLQWRHNELAGVSNHQPRDCLLNRLFRRRSKKTLKPRVTGLCAGNSPVAGEFPAQRASNAENVSIWWRHDLIIFCMHKTWNAQSNL